MGANSPSSLLGTCAYVYLHRKENAPISEMHLISNDIPRIGSALNYSSNSMLCGQRGTFVSVWKHSLPWPNTYPNPMTMPPGYKDRSVC